MHITKKGIITIVFCVATIIIAYFYYSRTADVPIQPEQKESNPIDNISISHTEWVWDHTTPQNGETVTPLPQSQNFVLTFEDGGTVTSTTDCNTVSASYLHAGKLLGFTPFSVASGTPLKLCKKSQEEDYKKTLLLTSTYTLFENELQLILRDNNGVMVFKKKEARATPQLPSASSTQQVTPFSIGTTQTIQGITITLNDVYSDSRCPKDVQCIQKGQVVANVTLVYGNSTDTISLQEDAPTLHIAGKTITLSKILPEKTSKHTILKNEYRITLDVKED